MTAEACDVCGGPLDDGRPVQHGLDGGAAHAECLEPDDEGGDE